MKNRVDLKKIQGCLMGVAIGDALGMPVETMKHDEIMKLNGGTGVTGFMEPFQTRVKDTAGLKAGATTDDWQLTRAVATSIIRCDGVFSARDCAQAHVEELNKSLFGWGGTTQRAIEDIRDAKRVIGRDLLPPAEPGKGCGNGVIMKVAPMAIAEYIQRRHDSSIWNFWDKVMSLGAITHPDVRASISACAVGSFIMIALENPPLQQEEGIRVLDGLIATLRAPEDFRDMTTERVTDVLLKISGSLTNAQSLRERVGCGFHAPQTAGFSIGTFLRHPTDFRTGVLEAVNAGGDTDTNASVVGALIGANVGLDGIPEEWQNFNPDFQEALEIGQQFYDKVRSVE